MDDVDIVIVPPFTAIAAVRSEIEGTPLGLGAQDIYWEEKGAFTGEISSDMVKDSGCDYVIVAHSERRQLFGETDKSAHRKVIAALTHDLIPIICVGETGAERDRGVTYVVVERQVKEALKHVAEAQLKRLLIAYEPFIRGQLARLFSSDAAAQVRILYGGSVKPDNICDLMVKADIDGALVGGASLKAESFTRICGFERRKQ